MPPCRVHYVSARRTLGVSQVWGAKRPLFVRAHLPVAGTQEASKSSPARDTAGNVWLLQHILQKCRIVIKYDVPPRAVHGTSAPSSRLHFLHTHIYIHTHTHTHTHIHMLVRQYTCARSRRAYPVTDADCEDRDFLSAGGGAGGGSYTSPSHLPPWCFPAPRFRILFFRGPLLSPASFLSAPSSQPARLSVPRTRVR